MRFPANRPSFRLLSVMLAAVFAAGAAVGNPVGPQVVAGTAAFSAQGNVFSVTNSSGAVIHWQGFSIAPGEVTRFLQPSAASSVLNRVVGSDPSSLLGTLQSNGRVFLINPAGILVGAGARVDTAGFIASTLNLSNADFLSGRPLFSTDGKAGKVENHGVISTPSGGSVWLIGSAVDNRGLIVAPEGEVLLAAGQKVQLADTGTPGVKVEITGSEGQAANLGQIVSEAGRIGLAGVVVRNSGRLDASSVVREGGRIFLKANKDAFVEQDARVDATGTTGGRVEVEADRVALTDRAGVDVSGRDGGGTVLVGGDVSGGNPAFRNASVVFAGADTRLKADAIGQGDGGKVVVWSDDTTRAHGAISVRGGVEGGHGGFVETSGKRHLDVTRAPDLAAPKGQGGTWLLDPEDITIWGSSEFNITPAPTFSPAAPGSSWVDAAVLRTALAAGGVVNVDTTGGGTGQGNITIDPSASLSNVNVGAGAVLNLKAHRNIVVDAPIQTNSNLNLNLIANQDNENVIGGDVVINQPIDVAGGNIMAQAGNININGALTGTSVTLKTGAGGVAGSLTLGPDGINAASGLNVVTDQLFVNEGALTNVGSQINIENATAGRPIKLGVASDASALGLDATTLMDLKNSGAPVVRIGAPVAVMPSGDISINGSVDLGSKIVHLKSGGQVVDVDSSSFLTADKLAITSLGSVFMDLGVSGHLLNGFAANVGDGVNLEKAFSIRTSNAVVDSVDGVSGVSIAIGGGNYTPGSQNGVIAIHASANVTQQPGALLAGRAVYAGAPAGGSVTLNELNPTGIVAGSAYGSFSYTSTNPIHLTDVNGNYGIASTMGGNIVLNSTGGGISQDAGVPSAILNTMMKADLTAAGDIQLTNNNTVSSLKASSSGGFVWFKNDSSNLSIMGGDAVTAAPGKKVIIDVGSNMLNVAGGSIVGPGGVGLYGGTVMASSTAIIDSPGGIVNIVADNFSLPGAATINGLGAIITPLTAGKPIEVYGDTCSQSGTALCLLAPDIAAGKITTPALQIGTDVATPDPVIGTIGAAGAITINSALSRGPTALYLASGSGISQIAPIDAADLTAVAATGNVSLTDSGNLVSNVAGRAPAGDFSLTNAQPLTVMSISPFGGAPIDGISANTATLNATMSGSTISIYAPITASGAVSLAADSHIEGGGLISGSSLQLSSATGKLGYPGSPLNTAVATLNGSAASYIDIANTGNLTIPTQLATTGPSINLTTTGSLTIPPGSTVSVGSAGTIDLTAQNDINIGIGGTVSPNVATLNAPGGTITATSIAGTVTTDPTTVIVGAYTPAPSLAACIAAPATPGCAAVLPSLATCIAAPSTPGCEVVLPSLATCIAAPSTPGCEAVLPSLATCISAPSTPGCEVVLPSLATCISAPSTPGCSVVLPSLATCISAPSTPGCSVVLPSLATCISAPSTPGCSVVLPSLATCISAPSTPGCSVVLPSLATCISAPSTPGCEVVLPTLATCMSAPSTPGCSVVLPSLATCISAPSTPGCSVVLPTLATCISAPSTPGCSVVLPSLATCISAPSTPGCSVVLPSLATCISAPSTPGCSVVLPTLATCISAPSTPGCSVVLPTLATCISAPSTPGCSVVLPTLATCISAPSTPGCSVVLPTLATCISVPSTPGCSVVLPSLATCTSAPSTPGCEVVLPTLATCISAPSTPGCSVVLPTLATCISVPTTSGCEVVLPSPTTCAAAPSTPGCGAILPTLATCIAAPATVGCSAVLPSLTTCIANPATAGCSVVLPSLATCTANPATAGCTAVLPSLAACIATSSLPGCTAVLPTLATCTANPATAGCSVVLPSLAACIATPSLPGCTAVLPTLATCTANPATPGCGVVLPSLAACITNPAIAGCNAVLPTLAACVTSPSLPGCVVILPTLAVCVVNPAIAGCSVVLPNLASCIANPTISGCVVVLPTLATCTGVPATPGCSAVLPSLAICVASPATPGCTVVLPTLAVCVANPSLIGCNAVLPALALCVANPALPGCAVVLPPVANSPVVTTVVAQTTGQVDCSLATTTGTGGMGGAGRLLSGSAGLGQGLAGGFGGGLTPTLFGSGGGVTQTFVGGTVGGGSGAFGGDGGAGAASGQNGNSQGDNNENQNRRSCS